MTIAKFPTLISARRQQGVSLFTVLVLLLLSMTAVLGAFRVANLNEALLGNTSDYNRAFAAAEAMVLDAQVDIRGRLPPYTLNADQTRGTPCRPDAADPTQSDPAWEGCRQNHVVNVPWFPRAFTEFDEVSDYIVANSAAQRCFQAICAPSSFTAMDNIEDNLATWTPFAATYGQYTRAGMTAPGVSGNPILNVSGGTARAWYWVEMFRYPQTGVASGNQWITQKINQLSPPAKKDTHIAYRITAVALGLKPGTRAVIRTVFIPFPQAGPGSTGS